MLPCKANWELVDITFDEGALMAAEVHNMSMLLIQFDGDIPDFELDKEQLFNRLLDFAIKEDIRRFPVGKYVYAALLKRY